MQTALIDWRATACLQQHKKLQIVLDVARLTQTTRFSWSKVLMGSCGRDTRITHVTDKQISMDLT
jgi:hypothetical protein